MTQAGLAPVKEDNEAMRRISPKRKEALVMAGKNNKFWTLGTLKSRGWTNSLIRELLPRPRYRHMNGGTVKMWQSDVVLTAEDTERFRRVTASNKAAEAARARTPATAEDIGPALEGAVAFFDAAWGSWTRPDTPAALLARRYHEAILRQVPATGLAVVLSPGQAAGRIENFLALAAPKGEVKPERIIKNFITAAPWLGMNPNASIAGKLRQSYGPTLLAISERALAAFTAAQPEVDLTALLTMEGFPVQELLNNGLGYVYSVFYVPRAIRTSLDVLVALNPKDEYPEARAMDRHFILHIGGTNTGKTYAGFQRLIRASTGVYLAPLRLLALEAQELLLDQGVACSLTTGEEEDREEGDTHVAATAEKLDLSREYEAAVIDECQMISDPERGYAWTRAILGVRAPEVHLCAAPEAKGLLLRIIQSCGDTYEVIEHKRKTPLICMNRTVDYSDIRPGDALITFSKVGVLSVAEDLRSRGKEPAIIYGALPYATRRKQVEGFLSGRMQYVVSTDAIGMGLNLPIRRIIFMDTEKFDGHDRRELKPEEIQQIAGRAGRYGMYDKGFVGATEDIGFIRAGLEAVVPPLKYAYAGFSDLITSVDFDLLEVLEVWNRMPTADPYMKLDISRYITIISRMREAGFELDRAQELRAANIPFDETDTALNDLFFRFLRTWAAGEPLERPGLPEKTTPFTLPELELHYRKLDLYFSFAKAFGCDVDRDDLYDERARTADEINQILLYNLKNNIHFCAKCGRALPLHHRGRLCNACYGRSRAVPRRHPGRA